MFNFMSMYQQPKGMTMSSPDPQVNPYRQLFDEQVAKNAELLLQLASNKQVLQEAEAALANVGHVLAALAAEIDAVTAHLHNQAMQQPVQQSAVPAPPAQTPTPAPQPPAPAPSAPPVVTPPATGSGSTATGSTASAPPASQAPPEKAEPPADPSPADTEKGEASKQSWKDRLKGTIENI